MRYRPNFRWLHRKRKLFKYKQFLAESDDNTYCSIEESSTLQALLLWIAILTGPLVTTLPRIVHSALLETTFAKGVIITSTSIIWLFLLYRRWEIEKVDQDDDNYPEPMIIDDCNNSQSTDFTLNMEE